MKSLIKIVRENKGFTLVELLIVIAVIAILAIAVLAALDPVEQLKKSRDTGRLADARELLNAYTRYYSTYNCYPEERLGGTTCGNTNWDYQPSNDIGGIHTSAMASMIESGELKPAFSAKRTYTNSELFVYQSTQDQMAVCFEPEAKSSRTGMGDLAVLASDFAAGSCEIPLTTDYDASDGDGTCNICVQ